MVGSSAVDHAHIASGKADGLVMYSGHAWDEAVGGLLVSEAGGAIRRIKVSVDTVQIASHGHLLRELLSTAFPATSLIE
jgi:fructose-1,6-bisphosphatase/inositol monophosphatase family enzyme